MIPFSLSIAKGLSYPLNSASFVIGKMIFIQVSLPVPRPKAINFSFDHSKRTLSFSKKKDAERKTFPHVLLRRRTAEKSALANIGFRPILLRGEKHPVFLRIKKRKIFPVVRSVKHEGERRKRKRIATLRFRAAESTWPWTPVSPSTSPSNWETPRRA